MKTQTLALSLFSILFAFNSNAQTLYVPSGTGGIGTSTNTNVGIGITSPQAPLDVLDNIRISGSSSYLSFWRGNTVYTGYIEWMRPSGLRTAYIGFDNDNNLGVHLENSANFTVSGGGGRVGIGTTSPNALLEVNKASGTNLIRIVSGDNYAGVSLYKSSVLKSNWAFANSANQFGTGSATDDVIITNEVSTGQLHFAVGSGPVVKLSIHPSGYIGIGTITPVALLHGKNGGIFFEGTIGNTPVSGAGTRMMWIPAKTAFRAGIVDGTQWDNANIGNYSFASGNNTKASGFGSIAMGTDAVASGNNSFSSGVNTTASGAFSIAFGSGSTASGMYSRAFGGTASGANSTSFGTAIVAQSYNSFVLGAYNYNPGTYNSTAWVATDPLFVISNGTGPTATSNAVTILKNGKVSIGVPENKMTGEYKLYVATGIMAERCRIALQADASWGDWVFEKDNKRMTFEEQYEYYTKHKHLKGIPSANELKNSGIDVAEMFTGVVINVEEARLDNIALYKENQEQKTEIEIIKAQMKKLQEQVEKLEKKK